MDIRNISNDELANIVKKSISWSDAMRNCGKIPRGASYQCFQGRVKSLGLDISHFLGKSAHAGSRQTGMCKKKSWKDILISDRHKYLREDSEILRRTYTEYCVENNIDVKCKVCKNGGKWFDDELKLEINHIDHKNTNNIPCNLEWLCPNCHSVETYKMAKKKKVYVCFSCGLECSSKSKRCMKCYVDNIPRKFSPTKEELEKYTANPTLTVSDISKVFGTNKNSVIRRCKYLGITLIRQRKKRVLAEMD